MAVYNWTGDGDGTSWSDPKNWATDGQVAQSAPGPGDDVTFGITAPSIMDTGSAEDVTVYSGLDVDAMNKIAAKIGPKKAELKQQIAAE